MGHALWWLGGIEKRVLHFVQDDKNFEQWLGERLEKRLLRFAQDDKAIGAGDGDSHVLEARRGAPGFWIWRAALTADYLREWQPKKATARAQAGSGSFTAFRMTRL